MKIVFEQMLTARELRALTRRPAIARDESGAVVREICEDVRKRGDAALREYEKKFDNADVTAFRVSNEEMEDAVNDLAPETAAAIKRAAANIRKFHDAQRTEGKRIPTMDGVECWREARPIERVGLYIPAGSAPLPSTVLMLGVPAVIAGCSRIVLCSPPKSRGSVDPVVLAAASLIGVKEVYRAGGAQAVAAMAYGTASIPKVDKIFGPGNRYVTAAKQYVASDPEGAAIDLVAGPSEVLILADESASPETVALDMISQAEHDADAQAVLVTTSPDLAKEVLRLLPERAAEFSRSRIIESSLSRCVLLVADSLESGIDFSNEYAPEHLVVNIRNPESVVSRLTSGGSVFLGPYAPVTAGDYASGTNHTLPTNGTARWASGVSLDSFQKYITFQSLTKTGLRALAPSLTALASVEGLQAHARAVTARLESK